MLFRIGVNIGDVLEDGENLLGDGVNVAARLESICQAGSVCVSKTIYDLAQGKIDAHFHDIGLQKVKSNHFHAFDVLINDTKKRQKELSQAKKKLVSLAVLASVLLAIGGLYLVKSDLDLQETTLVSRYQPNHPYRFTIQNLSGDSTKHSSRRG